MPVDATAPSLWCESCQLDLWTVGLRFDECRQGGDLVLTPSSVVEKFPEGHLELAAGFFQTGKRVSASAPVFATGAAAYLAALDVFANISFAQIIM